MFRKRCVCQVVVCAELELMRVIGDRHSSLCVCCPFLCSCFHRGWVGRLVCSPAHTPSSSD